MNPVPQLSLVIPAHNAAHFLVRTMPAVRQALRPGYELIVVDDCSTDNTAQIAGESGAQVVRLEKQTGPSGARNAGAAVARGRILAFIDADVEPHSDTLELLLESLNQHPEIAAVFGSYDDEPADPHLVSTFKNLMHHHVHQAGNPDAQTFWTGCGAIRRETFDQVGPFNPVSITCVEDIDYGHRLRDSRYQVWLRRDIQCKHLKRWTFWSLVKTDVLQRGVPWTVMMLRRGHMDNDLNLGWKQKISSLLAVASLAAAITMAVAIIFLLWNILPFAKFPTYLYSPHSLLKLLSVGLLLSCLFAGSMVYLQRDFYKLIARKHTWNFALKCIPMHVLYYLYSLVALAGGMCVYLLKKDNSEAKNIHV